MTTAARYGTHIRGSCDIAAMLLYVMAEEGTMKDLYDAEADAFWCLSQVLMELQPRAGDRNFQEKQAQELHGFLRLYDPPLADLLQRSGIAALPGTRLAQSLGARLGLGLSSTARLWDAVLADPKRSSGFAFCNYTIVAVLLLNRDKLLKRRNDLGALAEAVLAAPKQTDVNQILSIAYALCAFDRRCGEESTSPFPPRPGVLESAAAHFGEAAQTHLTSVFDKVRGSARRVVGGVRRGVEKVRAERQARLEARAALGDAHEAVSDEGHERELLAMTAVLEAGII